MAIFAPIFAFLGRQLGRVVTTALGWASTLLFGRVPQNKQLLLALMTLGSIAWFAMLLGVVFPDVGTFLIGFVPAPDFIDETWIRIAMLVAAIIVPLLIGAAGLFIPDAADRPKGMDAVRQVLRGYPLAFLLAFTLVFLAVVGSIRKARSVMKRWSDAHVPIVVRPGGYEEMVRDLEDALDRAELDVASKPAPAVMSLPARLVGLVAGPGINRLVPDRLTLLTASDLEIAIYPSDISISGKKAVLARARAAIASRLTASSAHLTTTKEAQELEDRLQKIVDAEPIVDASGRAVIAEDVQRELRTIDDALATLEVEYDEWEVLYRMRLQVERDLLAGSRVGDDAPGMSSPRGAAQSPARAGAEPSPILAIAGLGLVLVDIALALFERVRPPGRR